MTIGPGRAVREVGGRTVAWSEVGDGPALVVGGWWCSHLAVDWLDELFRRFTGILAERHRVIRYDRPGAGLSGRAAPRQGRVRRRSPSWSGWPTPSVSTR